MREPVLSSSSNCCAELELCAPAASSRLSEAAREKMLVGGEVKLLSNWSRVIFIHFETDAKVLQRQVPFELDLFEGKAYVSVVAFHLEKMRPAWSGPMTAWITKPIGTHELMNIRTYVRKGGEPGIYFLAEYLPNLISLQLGPRMFGLPYRWARLDYKHCCESGKILGSVTDGIHGFNYEVLLEKNVPFHSCSIATRDEFLLERYTAFTFRNGTARMFHIWHPPWLQTSLEVQFKDNGLLATTGQWLKSARMIGAHYSPGFKDVWMGWPRKIRA